LILLAVFRVGYQIPLPVIDQAKLASSLSKNQASPLYNLMQNVSVLSAADLRRITIFGLGIMPYISASIILQLWAACISAGGSAEGRRNGSEENQRIYALPHRADVCRARSHLPRQHGQRAGNLSNVSPEFQTESGALHPMWYATTLFMMTAGTMFVMWLGEQIDEFGIGNGISLLIMAGILAQMPGALLQLFGDVSKSHCGWAAGPKWAWSTCSFWRCSSCSWSRGRIHAARPAANPHAKRQACSRPPRVWRKSPNTSHSG